ncbi:MAG: hypothetical protein ACK5HY_11920 [Parahaliea sp.]
MKTASVNRAAARYMLAMVVASSAALCVAAPAEHDPASSAQDCKDYDAAAQRALGTMERDQLALQAIRDVTGQAVVVPTLTVGQAYRLALLPQEQVTFAVAPGRHTLAEGSAAGVFQFTTLDGGHYRINISDGSWVDVSEGERLLQSITFNGRHHCQPLRKYVEYSLAPGTTYTLQFSGGAKSEMSLLISTLE